jgi:hypothetical protein
LLRLRQRRHQPLLRRERVADRVVVGEARVALHLLEQPRSVPEEAVVVTPHRAGGDQPHGQSQPLRARQTQLFARLDRTLEELSHRRRHTELGIVAEAGQHLDRAPDLAARHQVVSEPRRVCGALDDPHDARVQLAPVFRAEPGVEQLRPVALAEAVALRCGRQDTGRHQLVERTVDPRGIGMQRERRVLVQRQRSRIGQRQHLAELARVGGQRCDPPRARGRQRARQVVRAERVRQHPAAGLIAGDALIDEMLRQLHRRARASLRELVRAGRKRDDMVDVTEHRAHELFGLLGRQRPDRHDVTDLPDHLQRGRLGLGLGREQQRQAASLALVRERRQQRSRRLVDALEVVDREHQSLGARYGQEPVAQCGLYVPALGRRAGRLRTVAGELGDDARQHRAMRPRGFAGDVGKGREQLRGERPHHAVVALPGVACVGPQDGGAEQLGLEHVGVEQTRPAHALRALDQQRRAFVFERQQQRARLGQLAIATDQRRRRQVRLRDLGQLAERKAGDHAQPLHDLGRVGRPAHRIEAQQGHDQIAERDRHFRLELDRRGRRRAPDVA